jgi:hypothetical protein
MPDVIDRVHRFLAATDRLREFTDGGDVAAFLRDLDCKGTAGNSDCPLARFIMGCIGDPGARVQVSTFDMYYEWREQANSGPWSRISVPSAFDEKHYPDLVDGGHDSVRTP